MSSKTILAGFGVAAGLWCSQAEAGLTLSAYKDAENNQEAKDYRDAHVYGIALGAAMSAKIDTNLGKEPLFCWPEQMRMNPEIVISLVNQEIRNPTDGAVYTDESPVVQVLFQALMHSFPCGVTGD